MNYQMKNLLELEFLSLLTQVFGEVASSSFLSNDFPISNDPTLILNVL